MPKSSENRQVRESMQEQCGKKEERSSDEIHAIQLNADEFMKFHSVLFCSYIQFISVSTVCPVSTIQFIKFLDNFSK